MGVGAVGRHCGCGSPDGPSSIGEEVLVGVGSDDVTGGRPCSGVVNSNQRVYDEMVD